MPMYGEIKLAFFVYLWYPKTKVTKYTVSEL
jgi:receptor expression-enhancing protein 1/2/3/4